MWHKFIWPWEKWAWILPPPTSTLTIWPNWSLVLTKTARLTLVLSRRRTYLSPGSPGSWSWSSASRGGNISSGEDKIDKVGPWLGHGATHHAIVMAMTILATYRPQATRPRCPPTACDWITSSRRPVILLFFSYTSSPLNRARSKDIDDLHTIRLYQLSELENEPSSDIFLIFRISHPTLYRGHHQQGWQWTKILR